jgi:hypothetical protein
MELELLAGGACADVDTCPGVFRAGNGLAAVVGGEVTDPAVLAKAHVGPGERLVLIDLAMLDEAVRKAAQKR